MSIEIRGLTITIGDKPIVRDACMDIADGERIGLVGSSGSGKSMIKALNHYSAESGPDSILTGLPSPSR